MTAVTPPARWKRWLWRLPLVVLLPLLASATWLAGSESGLRLACRLLAGLSGDALTLDDPAGSLIGPFSLQSVRWRDATLDLQLKELEVDWQPRAIFSGRLVVNRIALATLRVASLARSEPPSLPNSLRLPLPVAIEEVRVGQIESGDYAYPEGRSVVIGEALAARVASDGTLHRLLALRARTAGLAIAGSATLAADPPFALTLTAGMTATVGERPLALDLSGEGTLADFTLSGRVHPPDQTSVPAISGEFSARLKAFSAQPVNALVASVSGLDPAVWVDGAPQAQLDLSADLQPQGTSGVELAGRLLVVNQRPGAIDRDRLPITALSAALRVDGSGLQADDLDLRLSGGGRLRGHAALRDDELALRAEASRVDASAVHSRLRATQLTGPLRAQLGLHRQLVEADLRDAQLAVQGRLMIDPQAVLLDELRLTAGKAQLRVDGRVARTASGAFSLRGTLQDLDPSRFARLPAARVNASFDLQGSRQPELALGLRFTLRDSRFGKEALAGGGEIDFSGKRLRKAEVELTAAGNRLSATGAFGAAGDRLQVVIAAPALDPLGIAGDLRGRLVLGGSFQLPALQASLHSARLAFPGYGQVRGFDLEARVADGNDGVLSGSLRVASVDAAASATRLHELALDADGVRSQHRLRGRVELPGKRELRFLLAGRLLSNAAGWTWAGTLNELALSVFGGRPIDFLHLTSPAPLQVSGASLSAGPAVFAGVGWSLRLQQMRYQQQRWQTSGTLQGLPVTALMAEFPAAFGTFTAAAQGNGEPLRVSGEWDLGGGGATRPSSALLPAGRLRLWRESGDLVVGPLALGLEDSDLNLQLGASKASAKLRLRGRRLGEIDGEFSAGSSADAVIDRQAPWQGKLHLNAPDLAWVGPLIGDGWQAGGRLAGDLALAGTPAQPRVSGEWRGEQLALRALDQGTRLERGRLWLQLGDDSRGDVRFVLKQLAFESALQPMPRSLLLDPRLDTAALSASPGRVEASGELRSGRVDGFLTVKAERLGLVQRPDQWLLVSGDTQLKLGERGFEIAGSVKVDAGYWQLAKTSTPQLSDDVVIHRLHSGEKKPSLPLRLLAVSLDADLGHNFHFSGAGVESRLVGAVKLRSEGAGLPRATGTIRTRDGRFDAYGQKLDIERGILNFQGLLDNPGLNILAVRRNLPVEAGVEVTGTARRPQIRLVSDPDVADAEKLSWLVLGQGPDQQGGKDASVLMAAAQTILGGQDGGPLKAIQKNLGIDEFGVRTGTLDGSGRWQTSRIASTSGFGSTDTTTDQIVSVGKRLAANVVLSYDQSLSAAGSVVKLTVDLTRNLSLVGRAGTDTGIDLLWNYRFGR